MFKCLVWHFLCGKTGLSLFKYDSLIKAPFSFLPYLTISLIVSWTVAFGLWVSRIVYSYRGADFLCLTLMLHCNTYTPLLLLVVLLEGLLVSGDADHLMNPTSLIKMNQCIHLLKTTLVNSHTALEAMGYAFTMLHFDTLNWDGTASPPPPCSSAELRCIVGNLSVVSFLKLHLWI